MFSFRYKKEGKYNSWCKQCVNNHGRNRWNNSLSEEYKIRKNEKTKILKDTLRNLVYEYLLEHPCVVCGESDPVVLDFDHINNKHSDISSLIKSGCSIETINQEINKCQVLCANCHRRKTAKEFKWYKYKRQQELKEV